MKKSAPGIAFLMALPFLLSGCGAVGSKSLSLSVIYAASSLLAVGILVGYACFSKKLKSWLLMLLVCVTVVNTGYFMLSVSGSLEMALWSNRISYLGSVFLPLSMLMIILDPANLTRKKWLPGVLIGLAGVIFCCEGRCTPGVVMIAAGLVCAGLAVFLFYGCKAATKGMLWLTKKILWAIKGCFIKKEDVK